MISPQLEYLIPKAIGEACNLLLGLGSPTKVMTEVMDPIPPMKGKAISPEYLIDLKKIPDLDYLEYDEKEGLEIGTLTAPHAIETLPLAKGENPAVVHATEVVASTQIRTEGIMVGNACSILPSYNTAPNLLAQGVKILAQEPNKDRIIQAEDLLLGIKKASSEPGEIITGIMVPPLAEDERAAYIKHTVRKAMGLVIIGVVVKIKMEDDICTDVHIALGVVTTTPIHTPKAEEALIGRTLTDEVTVRTSEEAMDSCHPISDIRASVEYRKDMIRVFTKHVVRQIMECLQGEQENEVQHKFDR